MADEFGIQKAPVSGLGFIRFDLKRGESSWNIVQARGEAQIQVNDRVDMTMTVAILRELAGQNIEVKEKA